MATLSDVAANSKKIKQQIAEQSGLKTSDLNQKNLEGAAKTLEGAQVASAKGVDPTTLPVQELKAASGDEQKPESEENLSKQKKIAMTIAALAPTLLGYAFGGAEGGSIGAKVSTDIMQAEGKKEDELKKEQREFAQKKELNEATILARREEKEADRLARAGDRSVADELRAQRLSDMRARAEEKMSKAEFDKSLEGKIAKLSKEKQDSLFKSKEAIQAVQGMASALGQGDNTFSIVGDNDFTRNRTVFEEALGRMQSGGAITLDEERRFRKMAPTATDSAEQQKKKLLQLEALMQDRMKIMGFSPDQFGIQANAVADFYSTPAKKASGGIETANAAPGGRSKALEDMSEKELEEYVNKLKGAK